MRVTNKSPQGTRRQSLKFHHGALRHIYIRNARVGPFTARRASSLKMVSVLERVMSSTALLYVILIQGVCGTFFPPVNNPPPIPGQGIRAVNSQIYIQEDFRPEDQQPEGNGGFFQQEAKHDEPRWFIQEPQSGESGDTTGSLDYDRFYTNEEPAIGPVATPMPDDTYEAEPTSISRVKPNEVIDSGNSDIWVLTRGPDNQITPERWVQIQVQPERVVEVVNQEPGPVLATDTVKSIAAPAPLAGPPKGQIISAKSPNIVQQVWVQAPDISSPQKSFASSTAVVEEVPSIKQVVQIPPANTEFLTQVTKTTYPVPPPPPPAVVSKNKFPASPAVVSSDVVSKSSFIAPPPPPPPLKGGDVSPKVVSSVPIGVVPSSNILTSGKNELIQQVRHIWIPTSPRTGKFISIPISSPISPGKFVIRTGSPVDTQPIAVSDTWVLKENGPIPSFEQQKSVIYPSVVNKGIVQEPPVLQVDTIPVPPVFADTVSPKNVPVINKGSPNVQVDIWPPRNDLKTKIYDKSSGIITSNISPQPLPKTDSVIVGKSAPLPPPVAPKTIFSSPKAAPLPLPIKGPAVQIVNGKPCPIPPPLPQKSLFPANSPQLFPPPKIIATQSKAPLTRIIRVNRYPTGSYYLLNSKVRPSVFNYPSPAFISQARPRLIRLVQNKQIPIQLKSSVPYPVQAKQISVPVVTKTIPAPVPARQIVFPFSGRQIILPITQIKSQNRLVYPGIQNVRYALPWSSFLKASPVPGKRVIVPQSNPIKKIAPIIKSSSSSSESSSSGSSSESSEEGEKEEKSNKEDEKPQSEESSSESGEKESSKEESKSKSVESKEEEASESQSKENIETAESQINTAYENLPVVPNGGEPDRSVSHPYFFRFDNRDRNGTVQHRQETSDVEGRKTATYSFINPAGLFRRADYVADSGGFRVKLESNEPGTITHESANANFRSSQVTADEGIRRFETGESTRGYSTTDTQRD